MPCEVQFACLACTWVSPLYRLGTRFLFLPECPHCRTRTGSVRPWPSPQSGLASSSTNPEVCAPEPSSPAKAESP
jgi:hypothetical protein